MTDRRALSVERIVDAAASVADRGGIAAVSMRSVGRELGVEAMSLYHHVASKDALLDALTDWIFAQLELPAESEEWREGVRRQALSARSVFSAHPWSLSLVDARTAPGPAVLRRNDRLVGCFRRGGFAVRDAAHAMSLVDSYVYGFVLTERNLPFDSSSGVDDFADAIEVPWEEYPHLAEMVGALIGGGDYAYADEFEVGLDLILDALERRRGGASVESS